MVYLSAPPPADSTPVAGPLHLIRLHKHPSASRLPGSLWCRPSDRHPKTQANRKSLMRSTPPSLLGIQAKVWWPANVNRRRLWCRWPCLIAAHRPKGFRFSREGRNRDLGLGQCPENRANKQRAHGEGWSVSTFFISRLKTPSAAPHTQLPGRSSARKLRPVCSSFDCTRAATTLRKQLGLF
jgi:hypothetical protein